MKPQFTAPVANSPSYFVKLPLTLHELSVRGVTVNEEDIIKGSLTTPKKMFDTLTHVIYDCIDLESKKTIPGFESYQQFVNTIPPADRDALLWGIIVASYDDVHDMSVTCPSCNNKFVEKINLPKTFDIKLYGNNDNVMEKRIAVDFPDLKWKVFLKQPTLADELSVIKNSKKDTQNNANTYIIVDRIEHEVFSGPENIPTPHATTNTLEIYGMISAKPAKVRKRILREWQDNFGECGITSKISTACTACGDDIEVNLNPINHMFFLVVQF